MAALIASQIMNLLCSTIIPCKITYQHPSALLPKSFETKLSLRQSKAFIEDNNDVNFGSYSFDSPQTVPPIVVSDTGTLEGYLMTVISGREIFAFEGIPYAEPPVGDNRFRPPIPKAPWNGTFSAKSTGPECLQIRLPFPQVLGKEDCLTLQVYTPMLPIKSVSPNLPVMIFIHGGAYSSGSSSEYGPAYLLEQDIILITINYRLGVLGLLSTGDEESPGNYAFKDQALAIDWIVRNVHIFGGDPTKVTLAGQSSGAASVHFHMMSRLQTRNQFQKAMLFSGSALNFWSIESTEEAKNRTKKIAGLSFCPTDRGSKAMMACLRQLRGEYLVVNQIYMMTPGIVPLPPFPFLPTIEPDIPGAFITESPIDLYAKGDVAKIPLICTVTSKETDTLIVVLELIRALPFFKLNYMSSTPDLMGFKNKVKNETEVSLKILEYYGKGLDIFKVPKQFFSDISMDRYFTNGLKKTLQLHSPLADTYAAQFSFKSDFSIAALLGQNPHKFGVAHSEDMRFIFNSTTSKPIGRFDPNFAITKLLVNLYTNFISSGKPLYTSDDFKDYDIWEPIRNLTNLKLLQIDQETKMMEFNPSKRTAFWESLGIRDECCTRSK